MEQADAAQRDTARHPALRYVEEALRGLRYGTVTVTVHDGAVVQVERAEKQRVPPTR
jgi:hypothetical protein